jgi:hypothetical protein
MTRRGEQDSLRQSLHPCSSLRVTNRIGLLALFGALCLPTSFAAQTPKEKLAAAPAKVGVRVERVDKGQEAEAAGIQVGDYIVEWSRAGGGGAIESLFDWAEILTDETPRGTITLRGWRRGQKMKWSLGLRRWGLVVKPIFPERLAKMSDSCRDLETAGTRMPPFVGSR